MDLVKLFAQTRSGVVQIMHVKNGNAAGFGSGFFVKGKLVTNYHVAAAALSADNATDQMCVRFQDDSPNQARCALSCADFAKRVLGSSEEQSFDYLIADVPEALATKPYQFEFAPEKQPSVGQLVAFQGYPFGQTNLASHAGYVSSIYPSGVATLLQLDANVNSGNSGGPLFEVATGKLVGIISRKQTGLSMMFDELIKSFAANAQILSATGRMSMSIGGIDPVKALAATQSQLGMVAQEIKRSANVGIGFAVKATALRNESAFD